MKRKFVSLLLVVGVAVSLCAVWHGMNGVSNRPVPISAPEGIDSGNSDHVAPIKGQVSSAIAVGADAVFVPDDEEDDDLEEDFDNAELTADANDVNALRTRRNEILLEETEEYALFELPESTPEPNRIVQMDDFVVDLILDQPDNAAAIGQQLMTTATEAFLRASGALLLAITKGLDPEDIRRIVRDPDPEATLLLLAGLECYGAWSIQKRVESEIEALWTDAQVQAVLVNRELAADVRRQALLLQLKPGANIPETMLRMMADDREDISIRMTVMAAMGYAGQYDDLFAVVDKQSGAPTAWSRAAHDVESWFLTLEGRKPSPEDLHTDEINSVLDMEHDDTLMVMAIMMQPILRGKTDKLNDDTRTYIIDLLDYFHQKHLSEEQRYWAMVLQGLCTP